MSTPQQHNRPTRARRTSAVVLAAAGLTLGLVPLSTVAASAQTTAISAQTAATTTALNPGTPPTSVPAGTPRIFLGVAQSTHDPDAHATVTTRGRYTVEYDTSNLPAAFNTVIDGTYLQQTGVAGQSRGYSQTFTLARGTHTIGLGGPSIFSPAKAYLVGPLR